MFGNKVNKDNSLVFVVLLLTSVMVDQAGSLFVLSEGPQALLKDIYN